MIQLAIAVDDELVAGYIGQLLTNVVNEQIDIELRQGVAQLTLGFDLAGGGEQDED